MRSIVPTARWSDAPTDDLRRAIMMIADNLIKCNDHFRVLAAGWRLEGKDARDIRVRVAGRFCRIAYQMVAGRMTFRHPCTQQRDYILTKLITISLLNMRLTIRSAYEGTSTPRWPSSPVRHTARRRSRLAEELARLQKKRGSGTRPLGEILPAVLAKLGVKLIRSPESGEADPT